MFSISFSQLKTLCQELKSQPKTKSKEDILNNYMLKMPATVQSSYKDILDLMTIISGQPVKHGFDANYINLDKKRMKECIHKLETKQTKELSIEKLIEIMRLAYFVIEGN